MCRRGSYIMSSTGSSGNSSGSRPGLLQLGVGSRERSLALWGSSSSPETVPRHTVLSASEAPPHLQALGQPQPLLDHSLTYSHISLTWRFLESVHGTSALSSTVKRVSWDLSPILPFQNFQGWRPNTCISKSKWVQVTYHLQCVKLRREMTHDMVQGYKRKLGNVLVRISTAIIKHHDQKQLREKVVSFILQLSGHTLSLGDIRAGTEAEAMQKHCSLASSPWFAQPAFLQNSGNPGQGWHTHSGLSPSHISHQLKSCLPHRPSCWRYSLSWSSLFSNGSSW